MTVVALAIETTRSLNNAIERATDPKEAVKAFIRDIDMVEDEVITMILATVLEDEFTTADEAREFEREVELAFEAAVPELFAEGYVWLE
jgi:hypothetical protein